MKRAQPEHRLRGHQRDWVSQLIEAHDGDGCLLWPGYRDANGYGRLRAQDRSVVMATWLALAHDGRERPSPAHFALHSCDNPGCISPRHLRWGTKKENAGDAMQRGRFYLAGLTGSGLEKWATRNRVQAEARKKAIGVGCPTCGVPAGVRCKRPPSHAHRVHLPRMKAVMA